MTSIEWTEEGKTAFEELQQKTANAVLLSHPRNDLPLILLTDASEVAMGAALQQVDEDVCRPLAFFLCRLSNMEAGYSTSLGDKD